MKILLLILLPVFALSQKNSQKNDKYIYACQFIAGSADGLNQAIVDHYLWGNRPFWDIKTSWKNKYREWDNGDKRAAFPLSKSVLVGFTDGNHLTRLIDRSFNLGSLAFALSEKNTWKQIIKKVLISAAINRAGFYLFYNIIFE
jgi:hypothetical protein